MEVSSVIENELLPKDGFCYPNWEIVSKAIENSPLDKNGKSQLWEEVSKKWLNKIKDQLQGNYQLLESENFYILTEPNGEFEKTLPKTCEIFRAKILSTLSGIAKDEGFGKNVVIVFSNDNDYYNYISPLHSDGEYPDSAGICIYSGYSHIVLKPPMKHQWLASGTYESGQFLKDKVHTLHYKIVIIHELTHNFLLHLPLPKWLDEALSLKTEELILGIKLFHIDKELLNRHLNYWNSKTIQGFWEGSIWNDPDEGSELSYNLAQILLNKIEQDLKASRPEIEEFINSATFDDSGESAFKKVFEHSLGDLVADFLGDKHCWEPKITRQD
jgi:hypothetical protein